MKPNFSQIFLNLSIPNMMCAYAPKSIGAVFGLLTLLTSFAQAQTMVKPTRQDSLNLARYAPLISFTDTLLKNTEFHSIEIGKRGLFGHNFWFRVSGKYGDKYDLGHSFTYKKRLKPNDLIVIEDFLARKRSKISPQNIAILFQMFKKSKIRRFYLSRRKDNTGNVIGKLIIINYYKNPFDLSGYMYAFYDDHDELKKEYKDGNWITKNVCKYNFTRNLWSK